MFSISERLSETLILNTELIVSYWCHKTTLIWVNIGSGDGL